MILNVYDFPTVDVVDYALVKDDVPYGSGVVIHDAGNALLVVLNAADVAVADVGVVTGKSLVAGGYKLTVDLAGTVKSFTFDESDLEPLTSLTKTNWGDPGEGMKDIGVGDLVKLDYDAAGDLVSIEEVTEGVPESVTDYVYGEVESVDASAIKVKVKDVDTYFGDKDTVVYDCRPDVPEKVEFSAIRRGDSVQLFLETKGSARVIKYVKLVDPGDLPQP